MRNEDVEYQETLAYLTGLSRFGMNLGLERIQALMERLGHPERGLRVIHVGGTNGKGSTVAMIAEILRQAGYQVGVFISPHLHDVRERITINGQMIAKERVIALGRILRSRMEELAAGGLEHPTEFEVYTAMALLYFKERQVDFAVVEVGLGGEIDSTNVVQPLLAVITNVGRDHMEQLGSEISDIAKVKAGIIKPGASAVTAAVRPEALAVLHEYAAGRGVKLWQVGKDIRWDVRRQGETEQEFDLYGLQEKFPGLKLRLTGEHQLWNAATAVTAGELLQAEYGIKIPRQAVYDALKSVQWPGRLERISARPKILLDGAHNLDGAQALAAALALYRRQRLLLCLGMLADKEREKMLDCLIPLADEVIITKPNSSRSGDWRLLGKYAEKFGKPVMMVEDPGEAAGIGADKLGPEDMLCVAGSLYMLADVKESLLNKLRDK
ncbi:MAG: bifunctional folylpolyglutamate synthase/dihydrofolate synthase [Peptococcaceae bacterium]|jgi:dihydrofolate synthase/folylpolyglutamate synthase|nr:bifunctional folylpolyglutamate synthase/dihydrofolate synthase [Peptococcaceae bacterium]